MDDREREWTANRVAEMLAVPWDDVLAKALRVANGPNLTRLRSLVEAEWRRRGPWREGPTGPA